MRRDSTDVPSSATRRPLHPFPGLAVVLILATTVAAEPAPSPELHLTALIPVDDGGGEVRWDVGEPLPLDGRIDLEEAGYLTATTRSWRLGVDPEVTFRDTGYYLFVYANPRSGGPTLRYRVRAQADGEFRDGLADVPFELRHGEMVETGRLEMPIHDPAPGGFLSASLRNRDRQLVVPVRLGEENELEILLANHLNAAAEVVQDWTYDPDTWERLELATDDPSRTLLEPESEVGLVLRGQPRSLPALVRSVLPDDGAAERLSFDFQPVSLGRRGERVTLDIVVRFVPSLTVLACMLSLGVLLGSLTRLLFAPRPWRRWLRLFAASTLLSVIVWIAAIGLHAADSRVQLFGLEINPLDVIGVALIGILAGFGGEQVVGWLEKRLGLGKELEGDGPAKPAEGAA